MSNSRPDVARKAVAATAVALLLASLLYGLWPDQELKDGHAAQPDPVEARAIEPAQTAHPEAPTGESAVRVQPDLGLPRAKVAVKKDGSPVPGAMITVGASDPLVTQYADSDGCAEVTITDQVVSVTASKPGVGIGSMQLGPHAASLDVVVIELQDSAILRVRVIGEDLRPAAGMEVSVVASGFELNSEAVHAGTQHTVTNSAGVCALDVGGDGLFKVRAFDRRANKLSSERSLMTAPGVTYDVILAMPGAFRVAGRVAVPPGCDLNEVEVRAQASADNPLELDVFSAAPNAVGDFEVLLPKSGRYSVSAWHPRAASPPSIIVSVDEDLPRASADFRLEPKTSITGIVVEVDGSPVGGASVRCVPDFTALLADGFPVMGSIPSHVSPVPLGEPPALTTVTGTDGRFAVPGVYLMGDWKVAAGKRVASAMWRGSVTRPVGGSGDVRVVVSRLALATTKFAPILLEETGNATGEKCELRLLRRRGAGLADERGVRRVRIGDAIDLDGLDLCQEYALDIRGRDFGVFVAEEDLWSAVTKDRLVLEALVDIKLQVSRAGVPAPGMRVGLERTGRFPVEFTKPLRTNAQGMATIGGVQRGECQVLILEGARVLASKRVVAPLDGLLAIEIE